MIDCKNDKKLLFAALILHFPIFISLYTIPFLIGHYILPIPNVKWLPIDTNRWLVWVLPSIILIKLFEKHMYIDLKSMFVNKFKWKTFILFLIPVLFYLLFPVVTHISPMRTLRTFESTNQLLYVLKDKSWIAFVQPAVPEEIVFRAWYLNAFMNIFKGNHRTMYALITSNILFGIIHLPYFILGCNYSFMICFASFINVFLVGCLFGTIFLKTKNILVPIFFHWLWDTVAFTFFV